MAPMMLAPCAPAIGLRQQVAMPVPLAHASAPGVVRRPVVPASPEGSLPTRRVLKPLASAAVEAPTQQADAPAQDENTEEKNLPCNAFYRDAILLQGFGWDSSKKEGWYGTIASKAQDIKNMGFTHVWLPPPSQSVSAEGYLPGQLYNLDSKYGNKEQLQALIKALHDAGLKAMADIVINHRCADDKQDGVYNKFRDDIDHNGKSIDWGRWAITGDDPHFRGKGNPDTGADYEAAPDLDHANPELREALKDWLKWLQNDIGFDGWRFDYVKGFGAEFIKEYVDSTVGSDSFNVGEFWTDLHWEGSDLGWNQDAARQVLADWIDKNGQTCTAFDFPTKGILQEAVKNCQYNRLKDRRNKPPGFLGYWPGMTVTFVDNHDTGSTQQHWPFPGDFTALGYAYILTHPGIPSVFWDHVFAAPDDVRDSIAKMMALRRKHDIHADSKLEILAAEPDMYVARIDNKIAVKLGPRYDMGDKVPKKEDGWKVVLSGKDFAIWERE